MATVSGIAKVGGLGVRRKKKEKKKRHKTHNAIRWRMILCSEKYRPVGGVYYCCGAETETMLGG